MISGIQCLHILKYFIFIVYFVYLVQHHHHRHGRTALQTRKYFVVRVIARSDIDQPQHDVRLRQRVFEAAIHCLGQPAAVLRLKTRRIEKHQLRIWAGQNACDVLPRGLRPARGDADLLTDQRIKQSGFSGIGTPDDGDKAAAG